MARNKTIMLPMLPIEQWEVEAALLLAWVAYDSQPHADAATTAKQQLLDRFNVAGEICTFCTAQHGQKYVMALIKRDQEVFLFCAFAGSHLPGDWEKVNIDLRLVMDNGIGAPSHAGFLRRALDVPLEGIERVASISGASHVVFSGHSLGGAVAHLCRLRWLTKYIGNDSNVLGKDESIVSVAFGSPFFAGDSMLEFIKRHGWLDGFITFVNGDDPVPRVMNLAASLAEGTLQGIFSALLSSCINFITKTPQSSLKVISKASSNLAKELRKAASAYDSKGTLDNSFMAYYVPIGTYVIFPFHRTFDVDGGELERTIEIEMSRDIVLSVLGPVNLLGENPGVVPGFLNQEGLAHHDIQSYSNTIALRRNELNDLAERIRPRSSQPPPATNLYASDLEPRVMETSCECMTIHEAHPVRRISFHGENLDFVGDGSVTIDVEDFEEYWSRTCVAETVIARRSATDLVLEQRLNSPKEDSDLSTMAIPGRDIGVKLRSNVIINGNGGAVLLAKLPRVKCHAPGKFENDLLSFYGGQFFLDTQQHAWLTSHLFGDEELSGVLDEFEAQVREYRCVGNPSFLPMSPDWESIESVGSMSGRDEGWDLIKLRDQLYEVIVPPNGLEVRTKRQQYGAVAVIASALLIGGGIVATGVGISALWMGVSLTGGWGTANVVTVVGGVVGAYLFKSRFESQYSVMLRDLLQVYTGHIPRTKNEFKLEAALLQEEAGFQEKLARGGFKNSKVPTFDQYTQETQNQFHRLVTMIRYIHRMKELRLRSKIVAVCGPRDSGKTTLLSQLLHQPRIAARGTGYTGGSNETVEIKPYSVRGAPGYAFLDTPGLTGPDERLRNKFGSVALNLSSAFVYIREYAGLPTEVDIRTIQQILECAARGKSPNILICLNRCKAKLTEDAAGEIFHLQAETEKRRWMERLGQLRDSSSLPAWVIQLWRSSKITVAFVELKGDVNLEAKFDEDERTKGIWTTSKIGRWVAEKTVGLEGNLSGAERHFQSQLCSFVFSEWQQGYREERIRMEQEERKLDATMTAPAMS